MSLSGKSLIYKFISSSVGNASKTSFGKVLVISYEETPIGAFKLFKDHSTDSLSFPLQIASDVN